MPIFGTSLFAISALIPERTLARCPPPPSLCRWASAGQQPPACAGDPRVDPLAVRLLEERAHVTRAHGSGEVVTLAVLTAQPHQLVHLLDSLHTLGHGGEVEGLAQLHDRARHRRVMRVGRDTRDERLVD